MKKILTIITLLTATINAAYIGTSSTFTKLKIQNPEVDKIGRIKNKNNNLYDSFYIKMFKESYNDLPIGFEISIGGSGYESDIMHPEGGVKKVGYVKQIHSNFNLMLAYSLYNEFSLFKIKTNLLFGYTRTKFKYHLEKYELLGYKIVNLANEKERLNGVIYGFDSMILFDTLYLEFDLYDRKYFKNKYIKSLNKTIKTPLEYSATIGIYDNELFGYKIGYKIGLKYLKQSTIYSNRHALGFDLAISF
ncbi:MULTISPECIES: hypothetical protein [unclassified Campylobacter]|uniref:hypothetical protein n=2 Tax=unclassified Campylobacter TaxID=2593542 RepID=UPI001D44EAA2|nr:hypothetical protein [Campylobacter sp. RM12647]MBZ7992252.1 hypothetical protein [Campylobacter sp. RM9333]